MAPKVVRPIVTPLSVTQVNTAFVGCTSKYPVSNQAASNGGAAFGPV
jgi:hypothetical protein